MNLSDPANWDIPLFPISVAAQAAVMEAGTMRMWFQRARVSLGPLDAEFDPPAGALISAGPAGLVPSKAGLPRLLTLRTVLSLAAAAPLVRHGVEISDAYKAVVRSWTHFSEADRAGRWVRYPAGLYAEPNWTILIHYRGNEAKVVAARHGAALALEYSDLFGVGGPVPVAPTLVNLNRVDLHARSTCDGWLRGDGFREWQAISRDEGRPNLLDPNPEGS